MSKKRFNVVIEFEDSSKQNTPAVEENKESKMVDVEKKEKKKNNRNNRNRNKRIKKSNVSVDRNIDFDSLFEKDEKNSLLKQKKKKSDKRDEKVKEEVQKLWKEQLSIKYGENVITGLESSANLKPKVEKTKKRKSSGKTKQQSKLKKLLEKKEDDSNDKDLEDEEDKQQTKEKDEKEANKLEDFKENIQTDMLIEVEENPYLNQERALTNCLVIEIPEKIKVNMMEAYNEIINKVSNLSEFIFHTHKLEEKKLQMSKILITKVFLSFESEAHLFGETKKIKQEQLLPIFEKDELKQLNYSFININNTTITPLFTSSIKEMRNLPQISTISKDIKKVEVEEITKINAEIKTLLGCTLRKLSSTSPMVVSLSIECAKENKKDEKKGPINVIQLCRKNLCLVFNLKKWGYSLPKELNDMLTCKKITFVSFAGWEFNKLKEDYDLDINFTSLKNFDLVQRSRPSSLLGLCAFFLRVYFPRMITDDTNTNRNKNRNNNKEANKEKENDSAPISWVVYTLYHKIMEITALYDKSTGKLNLKK